MITEEQRVRRRSYEKEYRRMNPEKVRAKYRRAVRRWRERHPELNKERQRKYNATFRIKHPHVPKVRKRKPGTYYDRHRDMILAKAKLRRQNNSKTKAI